MSWLQKLYETYELQPKSLVGQVEDDATRALLPICHTTNKAQIEIIIDENGSFINAKVINESIIIPCTEKSSGRTSGSEPHPLGDKLQYVAGDFADYCDTKDSRFAEYQALLAAWNTSPYAHPKAIAVERYIKQKRVIADLVQTKVLFLDTENHIIEKWTADIPPPAIFKTSGAGVLPSDSFVRWAVRVPGTNDNTTWTDRALRDSWIGYYVDTRTFKDICFATGESTFLATQHAAKIRNPGDKAKLISSNDSSGFTYRGRFIESEQVAGLGLRASQEAHNALRWLIARQGYRDGDLAIVTWRINQNTKAPNPLDDTCDYLRQDKENDFSSNEMILTGQHLAEALSKKTAGYHIAVGGTKDFVVMGLDSASPGRMAIIFYRELTGSEYLQRIEQWHQGCAWPQNFGKDKHFIGAPSPRAIAEACYGLRLDEKLRKATIARLLPCIIEGAPLPLDIMQASARRACNRMGMEDWEWNKLLGIACALYRKYHEKEGYKMGLDKTRRTRDYLYGRLLAVADILEERALWKAKEMRPTTAARLMQRFADHPCSTWKTIELALGPYKTRLGSKKSNWFNWRIDEIKDLFETEDFINDKSLSGEFLLGYHCQRAELLYTKDDEDNETTNDMSVAKD